MNEPHIDPSRGGFDAFKDLPRDVPIHMLSLLHRTLSLPPSPVSR